MPQPLPIEALHPSPLLASFFVCPPPYVRQIFRVFGLQMMLITGGSLQGRTAGGRTFKAGPADLVVFPYGINQYDTDPRTTTSFFQVHFLPAPAPNHSRHPWMEECGFLPLRIRVEDALTDMIKCFERCIESLHHQSPGWQINAQAALLDLIRLSFLCLKPVPRPRSLTPWDRTLLEMEQNPPPRINALARQAGLSPAVFIRKFRRLMGTTPKQYILQKKVWQAQNLLRQGKSVKETAMNCGFADALYFSRIYRKYFGYPPSATPQATPDSPPQAPPEVSMGRHFMLPGIDHRIFTPGSSVPLPVFLKETIPKEARRRRS